MEEAVQYANRINSQEYLEYVALFQEFVAKGKHTGASYFVVGNKKVHYPVYVNVSSKLESLYADFDKHYLDYKAHEKQTLRKSINNILEEINVWELYRAIVSSPRFKHLFMNSSGIQARIKELEQAISLLRAKKQTPLVTRSLASKMEEKNSLELELQRMVFVVDYAILELPRIEPFETKKTKKTAQPADRNERIKNVALQRIMNTGILKHFQFKTKDECVSRQTSKKYYMKKDDIVNVIANTPELLKIFPKNFKALKKEDICDIIFKD